MATFSKFTKVTVLASLTIPEARALLTGITYAIGKSSLFGDQEVLEHLAAVRNSLELALEVNK